MFRHLRHAVLVSISLVVLVSAEEKNPATHQPRRLPGMQAGGQVLLPTQWSLDPAGKQLKLGDFPVNIALHPKEPLAAVLHAGYGEHEVVLVDLKEYRVISRAALPETFVGLAFSPDGSQLFASGAEKEVVHQFAHRGGFLTDHREIRIAKIEEKYVPAGLSVSPDGKRLFVACAWGHTLCTVSLAEPAGIEHVKLEQNTYPYTTLPSADGKRLYVSLWGGSAVQVLNQETLAIEARWPTPAHPTEMLLSPDGSLLYVACANRQIAGNADNRPLRQGRQRQHPQQPGPFARRQGAVRRQLRQQQPRRD
jgi:sugar lactone lactonase YvrE